MNIWLLLTGKPVSWQTKSGTRNLSIVVTGKRVGQQLNVQFWIQLCVFLLFFYSEPGTGLICLFHFNFMVDKPNWRKRRKTVLSDSRCFRILGTDFVEVAVNILEKT